jgi:hypothetical protein
VHEHPPFVGHVTPVFVERPGDVVAVGPSGPPLP